MYFVDKDYSKKSSGARFFSVMESELKKFPEYSKNKYKYVLINISTPLKKFLIYKFLNKKLILRVDGNEVGRGVVFQGVLTFKFETTPGKKTVEIELFNQGERRGIFEVNPVVVAAKIDYRGVRKTGKSKSWDDNPMGISAELIPPPCPVETGGKGTVTDVVVLDPGNGYPQPPPGPADPNTGSFPVSLQLDSVTVTNPGINYLIVNMIGVSLGMLIPGLFLYRMKNSG